MQNKATFIQKKCLAGLLLLGKGSTGIWAEGWVDRRLHQVDSIHINLPGPSAGGSEVVGGLRPSSNQLFIKSSPVSTSSSISFSTKKKERGDDEFFLPER